MIKLITFTYHLIHDITPSDGSWKLCSTRDLAAFSGLTTIRRILHAGWSVLLISTCHLLKTFWGIQATTLSIHGESRYHTKLCWTLEQLHLFPINRCSLPRKFKLRPRSKFPASGNLRFGIKPLKLIVHNLISSLVFIISLWLAATKWKVSRDRAHLRSLAEGKIQADLFHLPEKQSLTRNSSLRASFSWTRMVRYVTRAPDTVYQYSVVKYSVQRISIQF